jgi:hypothetical protein
MTELDVMPRRAGRIVFGLVLIAGAVYLATHAGGIDQPYRYDTIPPRGPNLHAWHIVVGSWAAATSAALLVMALVSALPRSRNSNLLRVAALTMPSVGIAMMLPITLHMIFVLPSGERSFDEWAWMSVVCSGHTHVLFALLVYARALALAHGSAPVRIKTIYIATCVVAVFPVVIPAAFVAVTGLPFIPLLRYMEKLAAADREDSCALPYATIRTA